MRERHRFTSITEFGGSVIAEAIRRQPLSTGKVALAWQLAAGPQIARATHIEIEEETGPASLSLLIKARDARWTAEIARLRPVLQDRLSSLLGTSLTFRIA